MTTRAEKRITDEAANLETYWAERNRQMAEDRDILRLTRPVAKTGQKNWVSNEPKVFYDTAISLISSYPARFRLPLTINFEADEKEKMNKSERFILGIFRSLDDRQMKMGRSHWLREMAYWVLSGWYSVFTIVRKNGKDVEFLADTWDPMTVYPEWDSEGLSKLVRSFEVDKKTASTLASGWAAKGLKFDYSHPDTEKVKVINYWRRDAGRVSNSILLGGKTIKPLTVVPNLDGIPIQVGAIGVPERASDNWQSRYGESIIAANRDMYEYENLMIRLMAQIMTETAYPNIATTTQTGAPAVKAEDMKGHGDVIPLKHGEKIELLKHAATPEEANALLQWVGKQRAKGSLPDVVYGGISVELSGFAISQLMAAIKYKINPYLVTMQHVVGKIASEFLYQYGKGDFPKIQLSTVNPKQMKKGLFFVEEFSKEDVPKSRYVDVTIPITSAMDKTQQIIFARQALAPPQLISRETLWEDILDIQDSEQEYARIIQDQTLELQVVKDLTVLEQLRERMNLYESNGKTAEAQVLKNYIMALEMQMGMRQGIPTRPGDKALGISPEGMPPEMINNPDMQRSALGIGPPGLSRRPQTPDERAESQGRKGILVPR